MDTTTTEYFSAQLLGEVLGGKATGMSKAMRERWGLQVSRGAVEGWLLRDQVPGPIVARIIVSEPAFDLRRIIARRSPAKPQPVTADLFA